MSFADYLMKNNVIVYVLDSSQVWEQKSSILNCKHITKSSPFLILEKTSTIYDISLLKPDKQQHFVENICSGVYTNRASSPFHRPQTFFFFEEAQLYLHTGQLQKSQELLRVISVGRNYNIRFALLTQFPSMIDRDAIKYCRLRFFGCCEDTDDVEYLRPFVKDKADILCRLETGNFICYYRGSCRQVKTKLFRKC